MRVYNVENHLAGIICQALPIVRQRRQIKRRLIRVNPTVPTHTAVPTPATVPSTPDPFPFPLPHRVQILPCRQHLLTGPRG